MRLTRTGCAGTCFGETHAAHPGSAAAKAGHHVRLARHCVAAPRRASRVRTRRRRDVRKWRTAAFRSHPPQALPPRRGAAASRLVLHTWLRRQVVPPKRRRGWGRRGERPWPFTEVRVCPPLRSHRRSRRTKSALCLRLASSSRRRQLCLCRCLCQPPCLCLPLQAGLRSLHTAPGASTACLWATLPPTWATPF